MGLHELIQLWRRRFLAATAAFAILLSGSVLLAKYEQSARETSAALGGLEGKFAAMRVATVEMKKTLAAYRSFLHPGYEEKTPEAMIYYRVDDIKGLFPKSELTISPLAVLPDGVSLHFSASIPDGNYTAFLNALAQLQARTFPFVSVRSVAIGYDQPANGKVGYKIDGVITAPTAARRVDAP